MYKRILGPLDGSKLAECSVEHIKAIATGCQASDVILLAVLEPLPMMPFFVGREAADKTAKQRQEEERQVRQRAEDYLNKVAKGLKKEGIAVQTVLMPPKHDKGAAEVILDYAEKNGVELIIMSTHGRSGFSRLAFGSVTDRIVRNAKIPVLTVSPVSCKA